MSRANLSLNKNLERLQALSEGLTELSKVPVSPTLKEKEREGRKNKVIESQHRVFKQKTTADGDQVFKVRYYKTKLSKHWAIFKSLFDPNKKLYSITKAKQELGRFIHSELEQMSKTLNAAKDKHGSLSLSSVASVLIDVEPTKPLSSKIDKVEKVTQRCFLNIESKLSSFRIPRKDIKNDIREISTLIEEYKNLKTPEQLFTELSGISTRAKALLVQENFAMLETQKNLSKAELDEFKAEVKRIRTVIPLEDYTNLISAITLVQNEILANYTSQRATFKNTLKEGLNTIVPDEGIQPPIGTMLRNLKKHLGKLSEADKALVQKTIRTKLVAIRTLLNGKIRDANTVLELRQLIPLVNKLSEFKEIKTANTVELVERRLSQFEKNVANRLEEFKDVVSASSFFDPLTKKQILKIIKNKVNDGRFFKTGLERLAKARPTAKGDMQAKIDTATNVIAQVQAAINNYHETTDAVNAARKPIKHTTV
jgi:hypothetical protein